MNPLLSASTTTTTATISSSLLPFHLLPTLHLPPTSPLASFPPRTRRPILLVRTASPPSAAEPLPSPAAGWLVVTDRPPGGPTPSRSELVDYYVATLAKAVGSARDAQACIYDVSPGTSSHFGFCCHVDEETSQRLERIPEVLSVRRDTSPSSSKDYSSSSSVSNKISQAENFTKFSPPGLVGKCKYWLVRVEKPRVEVVTKAQMVDYYTQILTKVFGDIRDAQASIYNISWENNFGFCCYIDEDCAEELADVPGVLSVRPDLHFDSENKDYGGTATTQKEVNSPESLSTTPTNIDTKRIFVTGLSFYTSEKTLRAAFESFGELIEVKVILDKISKRSKGYAFVEYATEEAAAAALKEMNGKIINGWMIAVAVAKAKPQRTSRARSLSSQGSSTII